MGDRKERVHFPQDWVTLGDWMGKLGPLVITGHHRSSPVITGPSYQGIFTLMLEAIQFGFKTW